MFYKRKGLPEEGEIVLCKVTKIYPNSVFVDMIEFNDSGMVHISEVSPGRIRNLRDYVSVGRQIVCKVLRIDRERGHIDLSLRRVNSNQRREKLDEIKQELKAEQLLKNIATKLKIPARDLYRDVSGKVFNDYSHLYLSFKDVVENGFKLESLGIRKNIADELTAAVLEKFKPKKIILKGEIRLKTYAEKGVEAVKAVLEKIEKISPSIDLFYLGGGRYKVLIEDVDYKPAEDKLSQVEALIEKFVDKLSTASFTREKD